MNIDNVLNHLSGVKKIAHNRWVCLCPVHSEKTPSMAINFGRSGDRIVMKCFGCGAGALQVMEAIPSLTWDDFMPERIKSAKRDKDYVKFPQQDILTALAWECIVAKTLIKRVLDKQQVSEEEYNRLEIATNRIIKASSYVK